MKKFFITALMFVGALLMLSTTVSAQDMPLPVDKDVRIGKLPNGLTYYIRHNEKPKGQADFYIAQKVGSILEEDNQRGLAHFLEHMCFNGTKNFPGNQIINWLETVGVKFGYNLNAYTSVDETVYNISNVPVAREEVQDSCLLILHDWANDLLLEDEEIDKERGVIHQEWRSRNVGQMRILENLLPTIYPDSKYAYRMPIGTMEVVDNFPYQALRDYYEAWYRPDQQGIIVVGDIDVDRIEGKIKEMFSEIEMPENAAERVYFPVPDNKGTIYAIGADPEQTNALVWLYFKSDPFPKEMKGNVSYLVQKYVMNMITSMLNQRLSDLANKPDAPFAQAFSMDDDFLISKTKDAFAMVGVGKDANLVPVLQALYREALRAKQSGFTVGEYQRAQQEYLSQLERAYNNRNDRENEPYVKEYVRNFIDNEPIPSIEDEYQMMQMIVPMINVDVINQVLPELITDDNRVVWALLPEKEGVAVPTEAEFAAAMTAVDGETLEAYVDEMKAEPLIPNLPAPGKIVSEKALAQWDATELTLSNGVKVIVKPTKFKADEIMFNGIGFSGTGLLPASNDTDIKNIELVLSSNGLGDYTEIDLQKYLSGKQAVVGLEVGNFETEISGSTTPKDLPTLMELLYMTMTNVTITEDEFKSLQSKYAGILRNQESNPDYIFGRDAMKSLFDSPRRLPITSEDVEAANRENILNIIHNATANAADFTFVFVGNIDMDTFRPLVEQYIATLPADASKAVKEMGFDAALQPRNGKINDAYNTKMQTPQTTALIMASGTLPYSSKGTKVASIAGQILSKRLLDTVREEMGAVYSIGASGSLGRNPGKNASLASQFPMKPEMKQEVLDFIAAEIERMQSNVTQEELNKVVEFMVKSANEGKEQNSSWLSAIGGWLENGVDTFNNNVAELQSITTDDIQQFLKDLMAQGNYAIVVLDPEAE
ncbi:MAG: insulinase family protein [Barnesiella sp.]|nr:insulinase family protein [Barnesiella sp.]